MTYELHKKISRLRHEDQLDPSSYGSSDLCCNNFGKIVFFKIFVAHGADCQGENTRLSYLIRPIDKKKSKNFLFGHDFLFRSSLGDGLTISEVRSK